MSNKEYLERYLCITLEWTSYTSAGCPGGHTALVLQVWGDIVHWAMGDTQHSDSVINFRTVN